LNKIAFVVTLLLVALLMTSCFGCDGRVDLFVDVPFEVIRRPTDKLCIGEEKIEHKGKDGEKDIRVVVYDNNDSTQFNFIASDLTRKQEEALALKGDSEFVTVGDIRFRVIRERTIREPENEIILVGTSNESPPCDNKVDHKVKDDRTFPALINEIGLEVYQGEKQTGPNDFIDEPTTAILVIKIEDSEEAAYQAIKDHLKDVGATDIQRIDGSEEAGYKIKIESTLKDKKIDVLLLRDDTGIFAVYSVFKEE